VVSAEALVAVIKAMPRERMDFMVVSFGCFVGSRGGLRSEFRTMLKIIISW
jgi:hypothetical protein